MVMMKPLRTKYRSTPAMPYWQAAGVTAGPDRYFVSNGAMWQTTTPQAAIPLVHRTAAAAAQPRREAAE